MKNNKIKIFYYLFLFSLSLKAQNLYIDIDFPVAQCPPNVSYCKVYYGPSRTNYTQSIMSKFAPNYVYFYDKATWSNNCGGIVVVTNISTVRIPNLSTNQSIYYGASVIYTNGVESAILFNSDCPISPKTNNLPSPLINVLTK